MRLSAHEEAVLKRAASIARVSCAHYMREAILANAGTEIERERRRQAEQSNPFSTSAAPTGLLAAEDGPVRA